MSRPSARAPRLAACLALAVAAAAACISSTFAAFTGQTSSAGNSVAAAPDFRAPTVHATVVGKSSGGTPGYVRQGGTYHVYANVTDTGNPASGIALVTANVSALTSGQTAVTLTPGSYSVGGQSYTHRSGQLTAANPLAEGITPYSIATADNASNSATTPGSVTVDNTPPHAADVQTANASGGTAGRAERDDTITYTFSEPVEPASILAGWNGSATNVVVRITDGGILGLPLGPDDVQIRNAANSAALPMGTVSLGATNYVSGLLGGWASFGATGTASSMTMSGNTVTVTLGTASTSSFLVSVGTGSVTTMTWYPSSTPYDRAQNQMSTATVDESGASDREF